MANSGDQAEGGSERAQGLRPYGRWSGSGMGSKGSPSPEGTPRAPLAPQLPAQAAQRPAEQSLHPANAKGDYFGLQNKKK